MFSGLRLARDARADEQASEHEGFAEDVRSGLGAPNKSLPPKYFYDAAGSELFEAICRTREYYPTRMETALLGDIARSFQRSSHLARRWWSSAAVPA